MTAKDLDFAPIPTTTRTLPPVIELGFEPAHHPDLLYGPLRELPICSTAEI